MHRTEPLATTLSLDRSDEHQQRSALRRQVCACNNCTWANVTEALPVALRTMFEDDPTKSRLAAGFLSLNGLAIAVTITITCIQTVQAVREDDDVDAVLDIINQVVGGFFVVELVLRGTAAGYSGKLQRLLVDPLTWVDVLALFPFFADAIHSGDPSPVVQAMRLLRLLRLFSLARHFEGAITLGAALKRAAPALVVPLYFLVTAVLCFAGLLYVVEFLIGSNNDFENVFMSAWFVLVTMTTVG